MYALATMALMMSAKMGVCRPAPLVRSHILFGNVGPVKKCLTTLYNLILYRTVMANLRPFWTLFDYLGPIKTILDPIGKFKPC